VDPNRYRLLVVDDEPQVAKALQRVLRRDYEVMAVQSGSEALAQLDSFQPHAVISDYRMPGMNGFELLTLVKERRPRTGRLIISGYSEAESELRSGNDQERPKFLSKPWDIDELLGSVRTVIEASK
jgi:response regulator RpfG family c-di-GMP phosphodiesterase